MSRFAPMILGVVFIVAGCHHRVAAPAATPAAPPSARSTAPAPPPPPARSTPSAERAPTPLSEDELFRRKSLDQLNAERPLSDVFFDYDENVLRDEARTVLQRDAAWLSKWPGTRILIEGHCDERGTPEYNLALGDRRALTTKNYLASLGISSDRVQIRSLGKESPFCRDDGESCWAQNRRSHFLITAK